MTTIVEENNVRTVSDECPDGWTEIDVYHPHSTPWDYHGMKHQREYSYVLQNVGIPCKCLTTTRTVIHVGYGTGPRGMVRFGDNMLPGVYRIAVENKMVDASRTAIENHKQDIDNWLNKGGAIPEACSL